MAITTGTCIVFDSVPEWIGDNSIDLSSDALAVLLLANTLEPDRANDQFVSDIVANEVAGNGYSRKVLTGVSWTTSGGANGQMMLDAANPTWTASGGSIVARWWVLFDNTPGSDATRNLIAYGLLDDTPADVTTTVANTLTLSIAALGIFTVGG
jgi:hypothetical protein